jgi:exosortase E/protease (VPEID-CTERM system)
VALASISATSSGAEYRRLAPVAGLVGLLVAEVLGFTISFDTQPLDDVPATWARLLGWAPHVLRIAITAVALAILISGRAISDAVRDGVGERFRWHFLASHLCAAYLFGWLSAIVMGHDFVARPQQEWWAGAWVAVAALTLTTWGLAVMPGSLWVTVLRRGRAGVFAGVAVALAAWAGGFLTEAWWRSLVGYTFYLVSTILHWIYADTVSDPSTLRLGTSRFTVEITPECSGYEGIGLVIAFLSVHLWLARRHLQFPRAFLLLPLGAAAIWSLNVLRLAALIVIGTSGWPEIALGGFHSQVGWLAFNAVALGLVALSVQERYFSSSKAVASTAFHSADLTIAYLAPFLAIVVVSMVTGALSSGFDWLYPARVIAAAAALWTFRRQYDDVWRWSWSAVLIGAVAFVAWLALAPSMTSDEDRWPVALGEANSGAAAVWIVSRVIGSVVTVPLAEELAFRGFLARRLVQADFSQVPVATLTWRPFVLSSLIFGALHGQFWLAGTIAGMLFGLAWIRGKALGEAILAHATTNALLVVYVFVTGHWGMWS